jgi:hypothetical protein
MFSTLVVAAVGPIRTDYDNKVDGAKLIREVDGHGIEECHENDFSLSHTKPMNLAECCVGEQMLCEGSNRLQ